MNRLMKEMITVFLALSCSFIYAAEEQANLNNDYHYETKKTGNGSYQVLLIKKSIDGKSDETYTSSTSYDLKIVEKKVDQLNTALLSGRSSSSTALDKENKTFNFERSTWNGERNPMTMSPEANKIAAAFDRDVELYKYIKNLEKRIQELESKSCPPCLNINGIGLPPGDCK